MRTLFAAPLIGAAAVATVHVQGPPPRQWIDPDTRHRIVRLTDDDGGSTLYFHDNAFSPEGDMLMVRTPKGIGVTAIAKIGAKVARLDIIQPGARGGYFARRTREIYFNAANAAAGRGGGR